MRKICGIGVNDLKGESTTHAYETWTSMLKRCYANNPHCLTYSGCSVHPVWHTYSNFKQWYDLNYVKGWQLDKDLLIEGNKIYSPNTCVFIPSSLNKLICTLPNSPGKPRGVKKVSESCYTVSMNKKGKKVHLGSFKTVDEAADSYLQNKKAYILSELKEYSNMFPSNITFQHLLIVLENRYS